jgi:hypothetical protein
MHGKRSNRRLDTRRLALGRALAACACLAPGAGHCQSSAEFFFADLSLRPVLGQAAAGATVSVLAGPVEVASGGGGFAAARDGMTLKAGDQMRTGAGGVALLTFFDGSETQLTPNSQIEIEQADAACGPHIKLLQIVGTTVDRVQRLTSGPTTNFSTDTPAATAVVRGTRYVLTVKCYVSPPPPPATRLLTFPRRVSGAQFLLADEVVYDDGGTLWEARAWQDPDSGSVFDTFDELGTTYLENGDVVYQEADGSFWLAREWQATAKRTRWRWIRWSGFDQPERLAGRRDRARGDHRQWPAGPGGGAAT